MNQTALRLAKCFTTVFPGLPEKEIESATISSLADWDSVATVTLLSLVGEEFGIEIDFDRFEELTSFQGLLQYLQDVQA